MERLLKQYGGELLRMCLTQLRDMALAEDAVQETFIKAYQKWPSFRGDSSEKTWLCSIAINTCRSLLRSPWRKRELSGLDPLLNTPAADSPVSDGTVAMEISRLRPVYREVILLYYYQELKLKEVAAALGINESAAAVRLSRAREQLKKALKGWYFDE